MSTRTTTIRTSSSDNGRTLVISGGTVDPCDGTSLVENIDDWSLTLACWKWERLTRRCWPRFEVHRQDHHLLHLWEMGQALWSKEVGWDDAEELELKLRAELGSAPRLDIVPMLYRPNIAHEPLSQKAEEHGVHRIMIGTVTVRYVEDHCGVQVTAEGELPPGVSRAAAE